MSTPTPLLGRVALHLKFITPDQLAEASRLQAGRITPRDAYMKARDKTRFEALIPD